MNTLRLLPHFLAHMVFGTLLFVGIALAAFALEVFTEEVAALGFSQYFVVVLRGVSYLVFAVDALLFILFLLREAWKLAREIWDATR